MAKWACSPGALTTLLTDPLRAQGRATRGAATLAAGLAARIEGAYQLSSAAATSYAELSIAAAPAA